MNIMYFSRKYTNRYATEEDLHNDVKAFFEKIATEEEGTYDGVVSISLELEEEQD